MSDATVATAMLYRLLHHANVVSPKADLYRMKERMKGGAATSGGYTFEWMACIPNHLVMHYID